MVSPVTEAWRVPGRAAPRATSAPYRKALTTLSLGSEGIEKGRSPTPTIGRRARKKLQGQARKLSECTVSVLDVRSVELDELLAEILALEQGDKPAGRIVDAVDHRFAVLELALFEIAGERPERLAVAILPVEHDHA